MTEGGETEVFSQVVHHFNPQFIVTKLYFVIWLLNVTSVWYLEIHYKVLQYTKLHLTTLLLPSLHSAVLHCSTVDPSVLLTCGYCSGCGYTVREVEQLREHQGNHKSKVKCKLMQLGCDPLMTFICSRTTSHMKMSKLWANQAEKEFSWAVLGFHVAEPKYTNIANNANFWHQLLVGS